MATTVVWGVNIPDPGAARLTRQVFQVAGVMALMEIGRFAYFYSASLEAGDTTNITPLFELGMALIFGVVAGYTLSRIWPGLSTLFLPEDDDAAFDAWRKKR